eukprot:scaffold39598_cov72-Phaeocystis_antarctica.AAC.3
MFRLQRSVAPSGGRSAAAATVPLREAAPRPRARPTAGLGLRNHRCARGHASGGAAVDELAIQWQLLKLRELRVRRPADEAQDALHRP